MDWTHAASVLVAAIAAWSAYASQRAAAKASVQNTTTTSRTDIEKDAFERARTYYAGALDRQDKEISRQDAEITELHAETAELRDQLRAVRAEVRGLTHELAISEDERRRLTAIIANS